MNSGLIIALAILAVLIVLLVLYFVYNNREVALRNEAEAQWRNIELVRDRMFKILQDQAHVANQYREAFNEIYPKIISGRYEDRNVLAKFIQESNPTFDTSLYRAVSNSVEVQRTAYQAAQSRLTDILRQRTTLLEQVPGRWFISNRTVLNYPIISSTASKSVMASAVDDYELSFK